MYKNIKQFKLCDLIQFIRGELTVLHYQGFWNSELCRKAVERIQSHTAANDQDYYEVTQGVGTINKVGKAVFDYADTPHRINEYYDQIEHVTEMLCGFFDGDTPLKQLLEELNNCWPAGAEVEHFHDRPMYYGLLRDFPPESYALPHQDMTHWDIPQTSRLSEVSAQFAANVYLQVPRKGGELVVYQRSIQDREEYKKCQNSDNYGLDIDKAQPAAYITIVPKPGDLVLFNSHNIHEVKPNSSDVRRITTSCFINFSDIETPLKFFS